MTTILLSLLTFSRFSTPSSLDKTEWDILNGELKAKLQPLNECINRCSDKDDLNVLGNEAVLKISKFCSEHPEVFEESSSASKKKFRISSHENRTISELKILKKTLRKQIKSNPEKRKEFHNCCKALGELLKREKLNEEIKTKVWQEKAFNKGRFNFSKETVNDTFGKEAVHPAFNKVTADGFYPGRYSVPGVINREDLTWFPPIPISPTSADFVPFDTSPFRPRDIRKVLSKSNKKSAPGPDGVTFGVLDKLDGCHKTLATLFSKVLAMGCQPTTWAESLVKLIHKKGDPSDPTNFRMIALSGCIGKTFHLLLNTRLTSYLLSNNLIDPMMQKAFLPGINGCIEHNITMEEIIKDARKKKRTCHLTFFDLEDAFGSVPHSLIMDSLRRNHLPANICQYFESCYSNANAVVMTGKWRSEPFQFKRGVFQGDPLSPTLFLMTFHPILQMLQDMEKQGYSLKDDLSIITLPYADDFCVITSDKRKQQKFINLVNTRIISMGMRLKPSKCRSFSLCSGRAEDIAFHLGDYKIPSIKDEEQKFLGKLLFFSGKSKETYDHILCTLREGLDRIEATFIRPEYKLWIYKHYFLPSKRFLLTVHIISQTHLSMLDTFTDQYVKKWAGLPKCGTNSVIHMEEGLGIQTISSLYMEAHATSYTRTRLLGDVKVNHVLDATLEREGDYVRTFCTTVEVNKVYKTALDRNTVQGEVPIYTGEKAKHLQHQFYQEVKESVVVQMRLEEKERQLEHVKSLAVQGKVLELLAAAQNDITWRSYMFNLKAGTLKFLFNACIDTLPSLANLKRWKKSPSDLCKLCRGRQTSNHVLNICKVGLNTGRFKWRHDNILSYIVSLMDTDKYEVYSDLPGYHAVGNGTIPPEVVITSQVPDIVVFSKETKAMEIWELTVPMEVNIDIRNKDKENKYGHYPHDLATNKCKLTCFEISNKGFISDKNHGRLKHIHTFLKPGTKLSIFKQNVSALALLGSFHIWLCRSDAEFAVPPFLPPPIST